MKRNYLIIILTGLIVILLCYPLWAGETNNDLWKITAYCAKKCCCGEYSDGVFASGRKVYVGGVACNWISFGTKLTIGDKIYTVEDRGAKSLFGSKSNKIKHIDIYMASHQEARNFGVQYAKVEVLND